MTKRFNRWLLMSIILVAVPFWWLLIANNRSGGPPKPVHIADLRALAAIIPGERPIAVNDTLLATRLYLGDYYAAGIGLKRRTVAVIAWTLPVPNKGPIIIDPPAPLVEGNVGPFIKIDPTRLSQIDAETKVASLILYTQGRIASAEPVAGTARPLNLPGGKAGTATTLSGAAVSTSPQPSFTTAQAVAPGVVVIPAPSYAPNARLIFVQLADGREFLFTGDIATLDENWGQLRIRSHLAALWEPARDGDETYAWLRTIRQLRIEAPQIKIVPGHDYIWLTRHLADGTITDR